MRRFIFQLEAVLRHRETIENLREQDYSMAQGQLLAAEARIAELRREFRDTIAGRPGTVSGQKFDAPAILDRERYLESLLAGIEQQERRAETARIVAAEMLKALVAARQAREAVTSLKEKEKAAYVSLSLKQEQDTMDEMATLRYTRVTEQQKAA